MLRFEEKDVVKEKFYAAKQTIKIWNVNIDNIVVSKLVETKTNSSLLIGIKYDKTIKQLASIMPKMSGYVKTFKVEDKIDKLMFLHIDDKKLLE